MTDSHTLLAIVFLAGIGTLGVLIIGVQLWMSSRNQHIAQHQVLHESATAQLFEFLDLDAEVQTKLWESYSALLDSFFAPSASTPDEELKKQTEARLKTIEALTLKRLQSLTKCAGVLPAETYFAAQDLYKSRGRMIAALRDTNYEDMHHNLYVTLLLYQYGFKARNVLVSGMRQLLGVGKLTVDLPEQWERQDSRTSADISEKLRETVMRRLDEKMTQPKADAFALEMKENKPIAIGETPLFFGASNGNGNSDKHDVA